MRYWYWEEDERNRLNSEHARLREAKKGREGKRETNRERETQRKKESA